MFLAMICFLQFLMGRHFLIENSGASKIFDDSPLSVLKCLGLHTGLLDQCMFGARLEDQPIKKRSRFESDVALSGLSTLCDGSHEHLVLRGCGPGGARTASAAQYPTQLCDAILDEVHQMSSMSQAGGSKMPSHRFAEVTKITKLEQVQDRIEELRTVANKHGYRELFEQLVDPWLENRKPFRAASNMAAATKMSEDVSVGGTGCEPEAMTPSVGGTGCEPEALAEAGRSRIGGTGCEPEAMMRSVGGTGCVPEAMIEMMN